MSVVIDGTSGITLPDGNEIDGGFTAKAWINFNGTGTVAIQADGNVSSITDNGTGDFTLNFSSAVADANYSVAGGTSEGTAPRVLGVTSYVSSSSVKVESQTSTWSNVDYAYNNVIVMR